MRRMSCAMIPGISAMEIHFEHALDPVEQGAAV